MPPPFPAGASLKHTCIHVTDILMGGCQRHAAIRAAETKFWEVLGTATEVLSARHFTIALRRHSGGLIEET